VPRRDLKRPYNHPLSTGGCNCQASEEERLNALLAKKAAILATMPVTVAMQAYMKLT
jgi:hypothetical protein